MHRYTGSRLAYLRSAQAARAAAIRAWTSGDSSLAFSASRFLRCSPRIASGFSEENGSCPSRLFPPVPNTGIAQIPRIVNTPSPTFADSGNNGVFTNAIMALPKTIAVCGVVGGGGVEPLKEWGALWQMTGQISHSKHSPLALIFVSEVIYMHLLLSTKYQHLECTIIRRNHLNRIQFYPSTAPPAIYSVPVHFTHLMCTHRPARPELEAFDLVVIGAGAAGLTAAKTAAKLGARVALIEAAKTGGDCTHSGCIPSKALLHEAELVAHAQAVAGGEAVQVDFAGAMRRVRQVRAEVWAEETPEALVAEGVHVFLGRAQFTGSHSVRISPPSTAAAELPVVPPQQPRPARTAEPPLEITSRAFIVATGAQPRIPQVSGLDSVSYWTYDTIWEIEELPDALAIIGGGPVACEVATAFASFGCQVHILAPMILPKESPAARTAITSALQEMGVQVHVGRASEVHHLADSGMLRISGCAEPLTAARLLVAAGRQANIAALHLEAAGVPVQASSAGHARLNGEVLPDLSLPGARHVFIAGDCAGGQQFTHLAGKQGFLAARNALFPLAAKAPPSLHVPRVTFTRPEVAAVGMPADLAQAELGDGVRVFTRHAAGMDRSRCDRARHDFVELVVSQSGSILGCTIVGARAGEVIAEVVVAMTHGLTVRAMADVIHPYPTYSIGLHQVLSEAASVLFMESSSARIAGWFARISAAGPGATQVRTVQDAAATGETA